MASDRGLGEESGWSGGRGGVWPDLFHACGFTVKPLSFSAGRVSDSETTWSGDLLAAATLHICHLVKERERDGEGERGEKGFIRLHVS